MLKDVLISYKKNKINTIISLIILSLFIFSTTIAFSIILNIIHEMTAKNNIDNNKLTIQINSNKDISLDEINNSIFSKIDGIESIPIKRVIINEKKSSELIGISSNDDFDLNVNILNGEKFSYADFSEKKVLIGKLLESETFKIGEKQYINIENEDYEVIGIMGSENLNSPYDLSIYIPINSLPQKIKASSSKSFAFSIYNTNEESVRTVLEKLDFNDGYSIIKEKQASFSEIFMENYQYNIKNIITLTMTIIIALINMLISSNIWIESQKYSISIKKALGASNKQINLEFFLLILVLSIISSIISIIFQSIFSSFIWNLFFIDITISNIEVIYSIIISFIAALGITLYQVKRVMKVSITNFIQE
ncbi:MAG: ABC transporter permease [Clostridium sp.]|uniref:ABC transporter permease n=1 Tax=Clostridium sp. TaxID=1506 RepID=UPI002A90E936|nr:ABC transporter permease [Clostridium sp.]MCI7083442.1 ABC transporter permease [Mycoplasmatota bacterium]MDY6226854.1 ABC transporter permease [Clostridium sp.]